MKWRTCTCYSVVVTSPLWAQELSFEHLLEIARTHTDRQQASYLPKRVSGFYLPIVAMPSQSYNQPFGVPLSPSHYFGRACYLSLTHPGRLFKVYCVEHLGSIM